VHEISTRQFGVRIQEPIGGHQIDPRMVLELAPDRDSPDGMGKGVIKRVCVPNSWAGNYSQYGKLIAAAQEFFQQSRAEPVPKRESRRLGL
jgi:hypothetical protein